MQIKHTTSNGVATTFIKTKKFKTITFEISFLGPFSKEVATKRSLLARVLSSSTKLYQTKRQIAHALYDLYDANIGVSTYPSYKTSITSFHLNIVNEDYLEDTQGLTKKAVELLNEFLCHPNVTRNAFSKKIVEEEKYILREQIENIYNNKGRYAFRRLLQTMSHNEEFSISAMGDLEDLDKITPQNLYETYVEMLQKESCRIFVIGNFDDDEMLEYLKILPHFHNHLPTGNLYSEVEWVPDRVQEIIETQDIIQSKLFMGFRINTECIQDGFYELAIFNLMFGGMFTSDLVRVIREENSLAYSISSQTIPTSRLMIVSAGINKENFSIVTKTVEEQLRLYQQGTIDQERFQVAKSALLNELREIEDSPTGLINYLFRNELYKVFDTAEIVYQKVESVKIEEISRIAQAIDLDTIYFLTSE